MTRLFDATFEVGALTGYDAFSSITGTPTIDNTSKVKSVHSVSIPATLSYFGRFSPASSTELYVSLYINITAYPSGTDRIIYIQNNSSGLLRVGLTSAGRLQLQDGGGTNIGSTSAILSLNTVYRIGVHYKQGTGSDGIAELFLATGDGSYTTVTSVSNHIGTLTTNRADIGNTNSSGAVAAFYVDSIRLDNASMPSADSATSLLDNLVAYWKLDETSGSRADSLGVLTLTDTNTVTSGTGKISNAALFTRANSEVLARSNNTLLQAGNINFSGIAWVKMNTKPAANASILAKWNYTSNLREYTVGYDGTSDRFYIQVSPDGTNTGATKLDATTFGSPSTGTWYMVYWQHDAVNDTLGISINNGTVDSTAHTTGIFASSSQFGLGAMNNGGDLFWDGYIDETGIWKRLLTSTEITFAYDSGNGKTYPFATSTDTPKSITLSVTTTLTIGPKSVSKPISTAVTSTVTKAAAYAKIITSTITSTVSAIKTIAKTVNTIVSNTVTSVKSISKPITISVTGLLTFTKGLVTLKTISYSVASTITFTKGFVFLKNITYAVTSAVTSTVGKGYFRTASVIVNISSVIRKNIVKPIVMTQTVVTSLGPRSIAKTIAHSINATAASIYGRLIPKEIQYVVTVNVNRILSIGKTFLIVQNTVVAMQRSFTLLIERIVVVPTLGSVQKNINVTKTLLVNNGITFSKLLANMFTATYVKRNVRTLVLRLKDTALNVIGNDTRTINLQDTNES